MKRCYRDFLRTIILLFASLAPCAIAAEIDFDRDVRPLLSDTCFKCHGPDDAQREAELRLDSREGLFEVAESGDLLERLTTTDIDDRMPPKKSGLKLDPTQVSAIRAWVEQGAEWKQHWSLVTPRRPDLPVVSNPEWVHNPIDAFVLAKLDAEGLKPSAVADPAILRRRLSFDITGLPPRIGIDPTVDDVLASTRYAERMAFRWLDAARYADTSGYQTDGWREMWRWRDWVIESFD